MSRPAEIFLSVAEASADMHAAALVHAAREAGLPWTFRGMTGPRLRALGVETIVDFTSHAAMLAGVFKVALRAWRAQHAVLEDWRRRRPDVVVFLDSPALHMRLAAAARAMGLPVLYYIAPQTWASREKRNRRIARDIDRLACILPFEEAYFRGVGVNATYVGHPLFETLIRETPREPTCSRLAALAGEAPLVALLPGSRRHVIDAVLPRQLEAVAALRARGRRLHVAVSASSPDREADVAAHIRRAGTAAEIITGENASLLSNARLVLVASGTATLHVAHYRKPMIVMYDAGQWLAEPYALAGRLVVKARHLSLVNVLAGARVVPEFMPFIQDIGPIVDVADQLLDDEAWRSLMSAQLDEIVRPLEAGSASRNVCTLIDELLHAAR